VIEELRFRGILYAAKLMILQLSVRSDGTAQQKKAPQRLKINHQQQ